VKGGYAFCEVIENYRFECLGYNVTLPSRCWCVWMYQKYLLKFIGEW